MILLFNYIYFKGLFYIFSLDQEQKEELIHVIEKLLSDKTTLVVGSAVMAFEEVCYYYYYCIYIISDYKCVLIKQILCKISNK